MIRGEGRRGQSIINGRDGVDGGGHAWSGEEGDGGMGEWRGRVQ